eukprot:26143-Pelagomonas_calceolata.AAC.12
MLAFPAIICIFPVSTHARPTAPEVALALAMVPASPGRFQATVWLKNASVPIISLSSFIGEMHQCWVGIEGLASCALPYEVWVG